ncbi:unnamed protein product, partial [Amoebophrya sp. A25]
GKFGDGLQSAVNVLSKAPAGCEVSLLSVGHRFEFESRAKSNCVDIRTLHYTIKSLFSTYSANCSSSGGNNWMQSAQNDPNIFGPTMAHHNPLAWQKYCEKVLDVDFQRDTVATISNIWLDP